MARIPHRPGRRPQETKGQRLKMPGKGSGHYRKGRALKQTPPNRRKQRLRMAMPVTAVGLPRIVSPQVRQVISGKKPRAMPGGIGKRNRVIAKSLRGTLFRRNVGKVRFLPGERKRKLTGREKMEAQRLQEERTRARVEAQRLAQLEKERLQREEAERKERELREAKERFRRGELQIVEQGRMYRHDVEEYTRRAREAGMLEEFKQTLQTAVDQGHYGWEVQEALKRLRRS